MFCCRVSLVGVYVYEQFVILPVLWQSPPPISCFSILPTTPPAISPTYLLFLHTPHYSSGNLPHLSFVSPYSPLLLRQSPPPIFCVSILPSTPPAISPTYILFFQTPHYSSGNLPHLYFVSPYSPLLLRQSPPPIFCVSILPTTPPAISPTYLLFLQTSHYSSGNLPHLYFVSPYSPLPLRQSPPPIFCVSILPTTPPAISPTYILCLHTPHYSSGNLTHLPFVSPNSPLLLRQSPPPIFCFS